MLYKCTRLGVRVRGSEGAGVGERMAEWWDSSRGEMGRLVMMGGRKTILVQSGENESDGARENRVEVIIIHDAAKGAEAEGREKRRGEGD